PTGRMAVMEGDSAVMALFSAELGKRERDGLGPDAELEAEMERVRRKYESELDARFAAARGFVDAIVTPEDTRAVLALALRTALNNPGPHLGIPVLPGAKPSETS
ncbi:MAG TPA: carboxyl transferase domain-containing protein, partial [Blastocatellia bacterium]|nr:carboxyl transferase domain-containing protein [Blastocatellia bacterium]